MDVARADAVGADAVRRARERQAARDADDGRLRGGVGDAVGAAELARHRGQADDAALLRGEHVR